MADPTTVPGLRLWLKADSLGTSTTSVSSWANSAPGFTSESVAQATASKMPAYTANMLNGLPALNFNGDDALAVTDLLLDLFRNLSGATIFAVAREDTATSTSTTSQSAQLIHCSASGSTGAARVTFAAMKSNAAPQEDTVRAGGRRLDADSFQNLAAPNDSWPVGSWKVATGSYEWSATTVRLYLDGSQVAERLNYQTAGLTSDTRSLGGGVGANSANTGEYFNGYIAEIIVYQALLTAAERAEVHSYLSDRYGITVADYVASATHATPPPAALGTSTTLNTPSVGISTTPTPQTLSTTVAFPAPSVVVPAGPEIVGTSEITRPVGWEAFTLWDISAGGNFEIPDGTNIRVELASVTQWTRIRSNNIVVVMGAHIDVSHASPTTVSEAETVALELQHRTTAPTTPAADCTFHIEGLLATGPDLSQGIRLNCPGAAVQLVNTHIGQVEFKNSDHRDGREDLVPAIKRNHPDAIQSYNGGFKTLKVDGLTAYSGYQGIYLKMGENDSTQLLTPVGRDVTARRTDIHAREFTGDDAFNYAGHRMLWNYGHHYDSTKNFPVTIGADESVWVEGHPNNGWEGSSFKRVRYYDPNAGTTSYSPALTHFAFTADVQGWVGASSSVISHSTVDPQDAGGGRIGLSLAFPATGTGSVRGYSAATAATDISANGDTLAVWVRLPVGTPGTNWRVRIGAYHLDSAGTTVLTEQPDDASAKAITTIGEWTLCTWKPTDTLVLTQNRRMHVRVAGNDVNATVDVQVDTFTQGTVTTSGGYVEEPPIGTATHDDALAYGSNGRATLDTDPAYALMTTVTGRMRLGSPGYEHIPAARVGTNYVAPSDSPDANISTTTVSTQTALGSPGVSASASAAPSSLATNTSFPASSVLRTSVRDVWNYAGLTTNLEAEPLTTGYTGQWTHVSGPALTLASATNPKTTATSPTTATGTSVYRWTLTRTSDSATVSADAQVRYRTTTGAHVALVYAVASDEDDYYPGSAYAGDWEPRIQVGMDLVQEAMARMTAYQGKGRRSFNLDRDADGRPVVHFVRLTQTGSFLRGTDDPTIANDDTPIFDEIKLATDARIPADAIPLAIWGGVRHDPAGTTNDAATVGSLARARLDGSLSAYDAVGLAAVPDTPTAAAMDAALNDITAIDNTNPAQWWDITDAVSLGGGLNTRWSNAGHLLGGWLHEVSHGCGVHHPDDSPAPVWSVMLFDVLDNLGRWFVHPEPSDALDSNPERFTASNRPRYTGSYIGAGTTAVPLIDTLVASTHVSSTFNAASWVPAEPATATIYSLIPNGSFEKGLTGWSLLTGSANLSQSTEVAADHDNAVLRVEVTAAGTVEVISDPVPVSELTTFSRMYSRRSATVERGTTIATVWQDSAGTTVSTTNVTATTNAPIGAWAREHSTTSPTDATITQVRLRLRVTTPAAGEVFYFDRVELHEGSSTEFYGEQITAPPVASIVTTSAFGTPSISSSSAVVPSVLATATSLSAPTVATTSSTAVTPSTLGTTTTVPVPAFSAASSALPAALSTATSVLAPAVSTGSALAVGVLATTTVVGQARVEAPDGGVATAVVTSPFTIYGLNPGTYRVRIRAKNDTQTSAYTEQLIEIM